MQNYELMLLLNPNAMDEVDDFLKGLEEKRIFQMTGLTIRSEKLSK